MVIVAMAPLQCCSKKYNHVANFEETRVSNYLFDKAHLFQVNYVEGGSSKQILLFGCISGSGLPQTFVFTVLFNVSGNSLKTNEANINLEWQKLSNHKNNVSWEKIIFLVIN